MAHSDLRRAVDVGHERGRFDRAADQATNVVSSFPFFGLSALTILLWLAAGALTGFSVWWLELGAVGMAGVTFLLVALVENQQRRSDQAVQRKLNAIVGALADLGAADAISASILEDLNAAVGLEGRESTHDEPVGPST